MPPSYAHQLLRSFAAASPLETGMNAGGTSLSHILLEYAAAQGVSSLLYPVIGGLNLSSSAHLQLRRAHYFAIAKSISLCAEASTLLRHFRADGIRCLPLKGISFAQRAYAATPGRLTSDIDLLVYPPHFPKALHLMRANRSYREHAYETESAMENDPLAVHVVYARSESSPAIELHRDLDFPINCARLPELWRRTEESSFEGFPQEFLSPEDEFLAALLHLRRYGTGISLRTALDLYRIVELRGISFDWHYVRETAVANSAAKALYTCLVMLSLCVADPATILRRDKWLVSPIEQDFIGRYVTWCLSRTSPRQRIAPYAASQFFMYDTLSPLLRVAIASCSPLRFARLRREMARAPKET